MALRTRRALVEINSVLGGLGSNLASSSSIDILRRSEEELPPPVKMRQMPRSAANPSVTLTAKSNRSRRRERPPGGGETDSRLSKIICSVDRALCADRISKVNK